MRVSQRLIAATVLAALSAALAGCGTNGSFDPTDLLDFLDTKKKLPGDRKPVFPDGVPGVEQGVPKELYKGAQQQQQDIPPVAAVEPEPAPAKRGAKPAHVRPSVAPSADQPAPEAQQDDSTTASDNAPAAPPAPKMKKPKRRSITAPDSDTQPAPQAQSQSAPQQQSANPFPAPMPSGGFQR
jgi:predicted small lipoprotein YifL